MNLTSTRRSRVVMCLAFAACALLASCPANAQMAVNIVHAFPIPGAVGAKGSLIQATDGNFYGVTARGSLGDCGTVFRMTASGDVTVIHRFDCDTEGGHPSLPLLQASDGLLYGNGGPLFRMTLDGAFEALHEFTGEGPRTALVEGLDGNLYGGTSKRLFRVTRSGEVVTVPNVPPGDLRALTNGPDGRLYGAVFQPDPIFPCVGTATIFAWSVDGTFTPLYSVAAPPCSSGSKPPGLNVAALVATATALYGVDAGDSIAFRVDSSGLAVVHIFDAEAPNGLALGSDGNFYGTTTAGGEHGHGSLFRMTADGIVTTLHAFDPAADGDRAAGSPVQAADGRLVGLTEEAPPTTTSAAFSLSPAGDFSVLHRFAATDGAAPNYLVQGVDGRFYGTTAEGGGLNFGVLFRLAANGQTDVLHDFAFRENNLSAYLPGGADTSPTLMQTAEGDFYGTTFGSGSNHGGVLYRATPSGDYLELVNFNGFNGGQPLAPPTQARDGGLYGTTPFSGLFVDSGGSVYTFVPGGGLTTIHAFDRGTDAGSIAAAVLEGADDAFYGTSGDGGANDLGTIFRMTRDGSSVTVLHAFAGGDGAGPVAPLIHASDGNFYGTTFSGGPADLGTIFRVTPAGDFSVVHAFDGADGASPSAALLEASDGHLYGVTQGGGAQGLGTVFRLTLDGTFRSMHSFDGTDGARPSRRLIQASDGLLYGTAERGGPGGGGVVFRLSDVSCEDTLALSYAGGTLNLGFHLRSALPSIWTTWLVAAGSVAALWFVPVPAISPAVSFDVPIPEFPHLGYVGVLTILANPQAVCGDWKIVSTGTAARTRVR